MVIKGQSVAGAKRLAIHLMRTDTNERAEILEMRGVVAESLRGGLDEIEAVATGTRCKKPFYHASINTRADERLTDEQRIQAIDRLEHELGLTGQPRMVVLHEKEGREHCHIVWSRIDLERMASISDSHNYRKHELVARELEREFGHARVQGVHVERDGQPRPARTPSHAEMQMAARGGFLPNEAKALLTDLWQRTDSGQAFRTALENEGWLLARGDRRDFVVLDPAGCTHSLARRIEGAKAADICERMADLDRAALPRVAEARDVQRERQVAREELSRPRDMPAPVLAPAPDKEDTAEIRESFADAGQAAQHGLFVAADGLGRAAAKLTDFVASLTESFAGAAPRRPSAAELAHDPEARRAYYAEQSAERGSDQALDRMRLDLEKGRGLNPADVRSLTHAHLLQIKAHGDEYLRQAIAAREDRERDEGRERDR